MKIRGGLVSNSSSTSFLLAIRREIPPKCPHCKRRDPPLGMAFAELGDCSDESFEIISLEKAALFLSQNFESPESIRKILSAYSEEDMVLATTEISIHNLLANSVLDNCLYSGSVIRLWSNE